MYKTKRHAVLIATGAVFLVILAFVVSAVSPAVKNARENKLETLAGFLDCREYKWFKKISHSFFSFLNSYKNIILIAVIVLT